jgi:hypothetical protein
MRDNELAATLLQEYFTVATALIGLLLKNLPADVRTRALDAVRNGIGKVELRTRVESNETELAVMPSDGFEPLWGKTHGTRLAGRGVRCGDEHRL